MNLQSRPSTLVLIEPAVDKRDVLAERLRAQGYVVRAHADPAEAIADCLADPPAAVIADLWMPAISGVQLCRLLGSEAATSEVPVILRAYDSHPRNRFWADRAGAAAFVDKGRMGMLVRAIAKAIEQSDADEDGFFVHLTNIDIRDRICQVLDKELHESLVAAEVRALSSCETFPRLFDLLSQLVCQLSEYRWLALRTQNPPRIAVHCHPDQRQACRDEVIAHLAIDPDEVSWLFVEDEDASAEATEAPIIRAPVRHAHAPQGELLVAPLTAADCESCELVARELGGPLRIVKLVEETQRLASHDPLTATMNRRAFTEAAENELKRAARYGSAVSLLLLDIDHFKQVNDRYGHAAGDAVLKAVGHCAAETVRAVDIVARWGGEEFVVALPETDLDAATVAAERLREALAEIVVEFGGHSITVTASIGVATLRPEGHLDALVERADKAMYAAKVNGRDRVMTERHLEDEPISLAS